MTVRRRVGDVRRRIAAAGGDPERVTIVAVTKGFGPSAVGAALAAGVADVGENYAQELLRKAAALGPGARADLDQTASGSEPGPGLAGRITRGPGVRWHLVGTVQRNKVARLAGLVHLWQAVDRLEVADTIARYAPGAAVLVEVNLARGSGRGGCEPAAAPALVAELRARGLAVRGLMAVGPPGPPEGSRVGFRTVAELADELGLAERSMGMTDDLEVAIEEGSTMVRVGRALFGPRPPRANLRRLLSEQRGP